MAIPDLLGSLKLFFSLVEGHQALLECGHGVPEGGQGVPLGDDLPHVEVGLHLMDGMSKNHPSDEMIRKGHRGCVNRILGTG